MKKAILNLLALQFKNKIEEGLLHWSYLSVRLTVGLTMLMTHGIGKLTNFSQIAEKFPDPIGLGSKLSLLLVIGSEVFGAIFLILGLLTRWSAFGLLFTMLVAAFITHGADPFKAKELAVLYALFFFLFTIAGGGRYSLDRFLSNKFSL